MLKFRNLLELKNRIVSKRWKACCSHHLIPRAACTCAWYQSNTATEVNSWASQRVSFLLCHSQNNFVMMQAPTFVLETTWAQININQHKSRRNQSRNTFKHTSPTSLSHVESKSIKSIKSIAYIPHQSPQEWSQHETMNQHSFWKKQEIFLFRMSFSTYVNFAAQVFSFRCLDCRRSASYHFSAWSFPVIFTMGFSPWDSSDPRPRLHLDAVHGVAHRTGNLFHSALELRGEKNVQNVTL